MDSSHWHILGAGAIGILYASWLKQKASLIINPNSILAQEKLPSKLIFEIEKNLQTEEFEISCMLPEQCDDISHILICTKAHQTKAAMEALNISEGANIVLMQNGMGNYEYLSQRYPKAHILCASTTHGAYRKNQHHIIHAGEGKSHIGTLQSNNDNEQLLSVVSNSLNTADESFMIDRTMEKRLWLKLAINCAINPLTAIYQCRNGELLDKAQKEEMLEALCLEIDKVLKAKSFLSQDESCLQAVKQVAKDTAANFSSMNRDIHNKQLSEIDYIQGYLCKTAAQLKIATPENQKIYDTIKKIEAGY